MESNSDKQLREKLQGFEVSFDPEAWAQMEDMLDKKKKRRGFFWWWFGGIAAGVLLFGILGYELGKNAGNQELAVNETAMPSKSTNNETSAAAAKQLAITSANEQGANTDQTLNSPSNLNNHTTDNNGDVKGSKGIKSNSKNTDKVNRSKNSVASNSGGNKKGSSNTSNADKNRIHDKNKTQAIELASGLEETIVPTSSNVGSASPTTNATGAANAAQQTQLTEVEALNLMWADKLNRSEDKLNDEKKEVASFPKRKKIFRYSIGVMGGLYATTPGWKNYNSEPTFIKAVSVEKAAKPSFYSKPSWMVSLTHDFTFVDRFAFTNGLLYSQTTFKLYSPYAQAFSFAPDDYTCSISELAIPTGIKVYPVATKTFRFYVSAGFIHHIKLKENFTYTYIPPYGNAVTGGVADTNYNFFPTNTDFTGSGYEVVQADALSNLTTVKANTTDFSINRAKRYYTSFYAGFGVEGIIKKHWILFAEPTYSMTMQRIGYQERRKYNFGGNAGFRYQF